MRLLAALFLCTLLGTARAGPDEDVLAANAAWRARDVHALERLAATSKGLLLEDYVQYWLLQARVTQLKEADPAAMRQFFSRYPDSILGESLRADWLKLVGRSQDWETFDAEYPRLANPDSELACYALTSRLRTPDPDAQREARALWFTGKTLPDSCTPLFQRLAADGALAVDDVWMRMRLAFESGNTALAHEVSVMLPGDQAPPDRLIDLAASKPDRYLERPPLNPRWRAGKEVALFALNRLARRDGAEAVAYWNGLQQHYSQREQAYFWGQLAYQAALNLEPGAVGWYRRAKDGPLTDQQLAWQVRAALRAGAWPDVLSAIERMSDTEAKETSWRYWKARALRAMGRAPDAQAILQPLARETSFYGFLAAEDLGETFTPPADAWKPEEQDLRAIQGLPAIARALELYRLGLVPEGVKEWIQAIKGFDDRQLLSAAEVARRVKWHDRAVNTAEKTVALHDFSQRYPLPYRESVEPRARQTQLDEAWLYGLMRQESRFFADARSKSGAIGLMQLMPNTANWVAKKLGWKDFHTVTVSQVDTNVALGTTYLRYVLDDLGHPVLATAAYNAGPNRARKWRDARPMEAAIYAESIPITETRDYVKKVMSNATVYAARLGLQMRSLKQRLGTIGTVPGVAEAAAAPAPGAAAPAAEPAEAVAPPAPPPVTAGPTS